MLPEPMILPAYGESTLADVVGSIAARLGCDVARPLPVPAGERFVLVLVDGLGWHLVDSYAAHAPYLAGLLPTATRITSGVPSTTVTSLTSLGTGTEPGRHGMAGYTFRNPAVDQIFSPLLWNSATPATEFQPLPGWFERLDGGIAVTSVSLAKFADSGLTLAALRGGNFVGIEDELDHDTRITATVTAATGARQTLVYFYERLLDHDGHGQGVGSAEWLAQLQRIDTMLADLRAALPDDVRVLITGDHGMLNVPSRNFLTIEDEPELRTGVRLIGGEGRFRQLYTAHPAEVAARWADRLGADAWVRTRGDAIDEGWFGPMVPRVADRFGDVLVAMRTDWAALTTTVPGEFGLVGMHGSLTPQEMYVPLLID
ncbi:alkaline phosphatase family protein [Granulicoccus phenolivorans]|uniref:alkaline phosphatase family protein n=1 Tax=Granulicoccus phenolivorans TaxID=266854 RepID=UPI0004093CE1|nr:nucleotide pyrophosphatase/phosphodiesterase family protein [Granulicoccus phenolivorans]